MLFILTEHCHILSNKDVLVPQVLADVDSLLFSEYVLFSKNIPQFPVVRNKILLKIWS
jgi:hypothetical protein